MMPEQRQVGGDHYLKLGMQPFHFTLMNGWDAGSHTILKYVSRHHNVPREEAIESLRKAYHIVEIMEQAMAENRFVYTARREERNAGVSDYCMVNGLNDLETVVLIYLGIWIYGETLSIENGTESVEVGPAMVKNAIEDILINRYGVQA